MPQFAVFRHSLHPQAKARQLQAQLQEDSQVQHRLAAAEARLCFLVILSGGGGGEGV